MDRQPLCGGFHTLLINDYIMNSIKEVITKINVTDYESTVSTINHRIACH